MKVLIVVALVCGAAFAAPNKQLQFRNLYKDAPGAPSHQPSGRIINGEIAEPHSIPYQAFLEVTTTSSGWYCGGSLIDPKVVLTAGHCGDGAQQAKVVLGAQKPQSSEASQVVVRSNDIVVHEDFDIDEIINDIALIRLSSPVELNENIQTVQLANDNSNTYAGETGKVSGWGLTDGHGSSLSEELRYVENPILSNSACSQQIGTIPSTQICLSGSSGHSSCNGDSGGPLTVDGVQVGVVSYGIRYCPNGYPSVFTRVSSYAGWIAKNSK